MKKIFNVTALALLMVAVSSCDSGFDELNTSKTGAISLDPADDRRSKTAPRLWSRQHGVVNHG